MFLFKLNIKAAHTNQFKRVHIFIRIASEPANKISLTKNLTVRVFQLHYRF